MPSLEGPYKTYLRHRIEAELPGSIVIRAETGYIQGFPDLGILFDRNCGWLEAKTGPKAKLQPNQEYWVERLSGLCFASFIYPEIEEEVLNELYKALRSR